MSSQTNAAPNTPYFVPYYGTDKVLFKKQAAPPLAPLDRGILYELNDGKLYFNGTALGPGTAIGDVSSSTDPSVDNALVRFDGTTGKIIQEGNIILEDGSGDSVVLSGRPGASNLPMMLCTDTTQKTALGLRIPADSSLGIGSTAIGSSAMESTSAAQYCTAVGANALFQCDGDGNVAIGVDSALNYTGTESNNICIDSRGVLGDNDTIRIGDTQTDCFIQGIRGSTPALVSPEMVIVDAAGKLSSQAIPAATGDVVGPAGASDNAVALWDTTSGKLLKNSTLFYTLNTNAPRILISGWENLLFTAANHSQFMGYKSGNTFPNSQLGSNNCSFGASSMQAHVGGSDNTAIGSFAMFNKTNQSGNTAVGSAALQALASGTNTLNTAVGASSLVALNSGTGNVAVGNNSGSSYTTTESNNICIGSGVSGVVAENASIRIGTTTNDKCFIAREFKTNGTTTRVGNQAGLGIVDTNTTSQCTLVGNQTGINLVAQLNNTIIGSYAGRYSTGSQNSIVGAQSLQGGSPTGGNNSILGFNCAPNATSAANLTICGTAAAPLVSTASSCVILGNGCAPALTTGANNILIAGAGATCSTLATGASNIIIGANAPAAATATSIIIGSATQTTTTIAEDFRSNNTTVRVGYRAANALTTGTNTVAIGSLSLASIVGQGSNTACGYQAGQGTTGQFNAIFGTSSMNTAGTSFNNSIFGATAAQAITSGGNNCAFGLGSLPAGTTCSNIIAIGATSGGVQATGSNCIYIAANAAVAAEANTIRIGTGGGTHTRAFVAGVSGVTTGGAAVACLVDANGQLGTVSSSRLVKENIRPIESTDWLHQLELKNFEYINGTVLSEDPESPDYNKKQKQVGVIAEDVELIKPELVIMQGNGIKTVDYNALYVCALKELQLLHARLASLVDRVASLEAAAAP